MLNERLLKLGTDIFASKRLLWCQTEDPILMFKRIQKLALKLDSEIETASISKVFTQVSYPDILVMDHRQNIYKYPLQEEIILDGGDLFSRNNIVDVDEDNPFDFLERQKSLVVMFNPLFLNNLTLLEDFIKMLHCNTQRSPFIVISREPMHKDLKGIAHEIEFDSLSVDEIKNLLDEYELEDPKDLFKLMGLNERFLKDLITYSKEGNILKKDLYEEFLMSLRDTSLIEIKESSMTVEDLVGYDSFKIYLNNLPKFFTKEAEDAGIEQPKGFLAFGIPGCSKTVSAEITASILNVPFVEFKIGKVLSSTVGSSERNMAEALRQIKSIGKCVLLIDEIEKVFGGMQSSNSSDAGTLSRVGSQLLTFLNEDHEAFAVFTSNDVMALPAELLRSGRLDSKWFFNVPTIKERMLIFKHYLNKYNVKLTTEQIRSIIELTDNYTGAEIKEICSNLKKEFFLHSNIDEESVKRSVSLVSSVYKSNKVQYTVLQEMAKEMSISAS